MTSPNASRGPTPPDAGARREAVSWGGRDTERRAAWQQLDQSSIMTVELLTAILTWGGIGWLLDHGLDTRPWFMAVGVLAGFAAGLYLVWLRSSDESTAPGAGTDPVAHDREGTQA